MFEHSRVLLISFNVHYPVQLGLRLELPGAVRFDRTDGWITHQQFLSRRSCRQVVKLVNDQLLSFYTVALILKITVALNRIT